MCSVLYNPGSQTSELSDIKVSFHICEVVSSGRWSSEKNAGIVVKMRKKKTQRNQKHVIRMEN